MQPAGPIVIFAFVCLLVRLSQYREAWKRFNGKQLEWLELAGLFASSLQKKVKRRQYNRQSTVEAQLLLHKRERAPEAQECQENGGAINYEPDEARICNDVTVHCVL